MGSFTKHEISEKTQKLVAVAGSQAPLPSPSKNTEDQPAIANVQETACEVLSSCPELMTLKEETKRTEVISCVLPRSKSLTNETLGLKAFFGPNVMLRIDQYTIRHKAGYIKIEDGKVGYIYPVRPSQVYIRTAPGEKDRLVQWRDNFRYCLQGSLIFKPAEGPIDYVMFTFEKGE